MGFLYSCWIIIVISSVIDENPVGDKYHLHKSCVLIKSTLDY